MECIETGHEGTIDIWLHFCHFILNRSIDQRMIQRSGRSQDVKFQLARIVEIDGRQTEPTLLTYFSVLFRTWETTEMQRGVFLLRRYPEGMMMEAAGTVVHGCCNFERSRSYHEVTCRSNICLRWSLIHFQKVRRSSIACDAFRHRQGSTFSLALPANQPTSTWCCGFIA